MRSQNKQMRGAVWGMDGFRFDINTPLNNQADQHRDAMLEMQNLLIRGSGYQTTKGLMEN